MRNSAESGWCLRVVLCIVLCNVACVIEKIDAIVAEHGVTYWPSSSDSEDGPLDTSMSTSTTDVSDSGAGTHSSTSGSDMPPDTTMQDEPDRGSSTGTPGPVCGDGVVQDDEACDDGNAIPDDGCQECAKDSIVFVSSESYQGYALGGLAGADQRCRSLAAKADLQRPETFRAWLSVPGLAVTDRLLHSRGRYKLVNGIVVAQDWDALTSGTLQNPINVDEYSQTHEVFVWTGTLADGQPALGSEFCGEWEDDSGLLMFGGEGLSIMADSEWAFFDQGECGSENHIYCVEQ